MNTPALLISSLIYPTLTHLKAKVYAAQNETDINNIVATLKLASTRTNIHRFDEGELARAYGMN